MAIVQQEAYKKADKHLENIKILIVEGSLNAGSLIRKILHRLGFKGVHVVKNGFEGVKLMKESHIDIVFTDWELLVHNKNKTTNDDGKHPEILPINGSLFVKRLRSSPSSPNPFIPVVMLVKSESERDIALARDSGANEIIVKPFSADDFSRKIINLIDDPRAFITAASYRGPCRRRSKDELPPGAAERRVRPVQRVRRHEGKWI